VCESVEPQGAHMASKRRFPGEEEILRDLGGKELRVVRERAFAQGTKDRPGAEELWAEIGKGQITPVIYRDLPYKRVHANLQVPVSCGCELAEWGREKGLDGGCTFCEIGRFSDYHYLNPSEIASLVGLILRRSRFAPRFWEKKQRCLVVSFSAAGEPLLRYQTVRDTIVKLRSIFERRGIRIFFSVCTSGIANGIQQMLEDIVFCDEHRIQLRFSMHFPTDSEREHFIPAKDSIQRVMQLGTDYARAVKIKLIIHYGLIRGVNDSDSHAEKLIELFHPQRDNILVRISRINPECGAKQVRLFPSSKTRRRGFIHRLKQGGIECSPVWEGYARWACNAAHFR
jgi:hypothetical protein